MSSCLVRSFRAIFTDSARPGASNILERIVSSNGVFSGLLCPSAALTHVPEHTAHSRAFSAAAGQATSRASQSESSEHRKHTSFCCSGARSFHASAAAGVPNYYQTLGVPQSASEGEIKKAYYKLAKRYHPDANPDNEDAVKKFQEVQEAYDILRDAQKRAMYDQVGHQQFKSSGAGDGNAGGFQGQGFPGGFPFQGNFQGGGFTFHSSGGFAGGAHAMDEVLQDMAKEFFGGGRKRSSMFSSYQASTSVSITFMESLQGTKRKLDVHLGDSDDQHAVEVDIPAGIENGSQLLMQDVVRTRQHRVSLVVQVQVQPQRGFTRKGDDIFSRLELKLSEALLGCQKEVETAWGPKTVTVPEGTTASSRIVIDSMGAPRLKGSGRGRHILEVSLKLPQRLTSDQIRVVEELRNSGL